MFTAFIGLAHYKLYFKSNETRTEDQPVLQWHVGWCLLTKLINQDNATRGRLQK